MAAGGGPCGDGCRMLSPCLRLCCTMSSAQKSMESFAFLGAFPVHAAIGSMDKNN